MDKPEMRHDVKLSEDPRQDFPDALAAMTYELNLRYEDYGLSGYPDSDSVALMNVLLRFGWRPASAHDGLREALRHIAEGTGPMVDVPHVDRGEVAGDIAEAALSRDGAPKGPRHFGPMHGERTRRHAMEVDGPRTPALTVYEHQVDGKPRLAVELTAAADGHISNERADLTVAEARALREWLAEFIVAWEDET